MHGFAWLAVLQFMAIILHYYDNNQAPHQNTIGRNQQKNACVSILPCNQKTLPRKQTNRNHTKKHDAVQYQTRVRVPVCHRSRMIMIAPPSSFQLHHQHHHQKQILLLGLLALNNPYDAILPSYHGIITRNSTRGQALRGLSNIQ